MKSIVTVPMVVVAALAASALSALADGPFQYHSLTPCRLFDTRSTTAMSQGETRAFQVQGLCLVPTGAKAVSVNVTAVSPTGNGYLSLFPNTGSTTPPLVSSLNFSSTCGTATGNGAIVPLGDATVYPNQDLYIYARVAATPGTVHVVLDVTGYFQ
jgi:hypothetical protein